jgi:hypothetical protein
MARLFAALAFAFMLVGLSAHLTSAKSYDSGPARSPAVERKACLDGGGTWTTEHNGNVGICTYPDGTQDRCRFKTTGRCSISLPLEATPTSPMNPNVTAAGADVQDASNDGTITGSPKSGAAATSSSVITKSTDD